MSIPVTSGRTSKPRLRAIEYIRGISMMGVIAIHVGSQYIENPMANPQLIALLEICTRFSIPIFFFISAFGLFYNLDMAARFDYRSFLSRRFKAVLIPYVVWSVFYVVHDSFLYHTGLPGPLHFLSLLFFGNAKYQLYFLVILLWFYILMPLWIPIVKRLGFVSLAVLLAVQIGFDYWSSYSVPFNLFIYGLPDDSWLKPFLLYRLNYWPFHYVFIFLLGGYLALHMEGFRRLLREKKALLTAFFLVTLAALLAFYYQLLTVDGYTPMEAINTAHQLSPAGIFYTLASCLFFMLFTEVRFPHALHWVLHELGRHSYFAYLCHPFFIGYIALFIAHAGRIQTAGLTIAFYFVALLLSVLAAAICRKIGEYVPLLNELTIGVFPKKRKG